jgi:hypothetical protein
MPTKYPIEYELNPEDIEAGRRWLTLRLKNTGETALDDLDVRLNTLDTYNITVNEASTYVAQLKPGEETELPFQVNATASGSVYVTLDGQVNENPFHWESPARQVTVGRPTARLVSLFALTEPRTILGEPITCEATIQGLTPTRGLSLEFWVQTPGEEMLSVAKMPVEPVAVGEEVKYEAEITPREEGLYTIHAYLYESQRRIDHEIEYISVSLS